MDRVRAGGAGANERWYGKLSGHDGNGLLATGPLCYQHAGQRLHLYDRHFEWGAGGQRYGYGGGGGLLGTRGWGNRQSGLGQYESVFGKFLRWCGGVHERDRTLLGRSLLLSFHGVQCRLGNVGARHGDVQDDGPVPRRVQSACDAGHDVFRHIEWLSFLHREFPHHGIGSMGDDGCRGRDERLGPYQYLWGCDPARGDVHECGARTGFLLLLSLLRNE